MFVFGSSLVDNGNNNFLPGARSKANYTPYGIDFPAGPTGRYNNGKNVVDLLCDKLGLPLLPPSRDPATAADGGEGISHGVDFASGGSGIFNDTGAITHLHGLGARKFVMMSLNPLGCNPIVLIRHPENGTFTCSQSLNQAAQLFNEKLKSMVDQLNQQLPRSKLVIVNAYNIINEILNNPGLSGFRDSSNSCCETITVPCIRGGKACKDRKDHVFFDAHHPTEAVNVQIVNKAYSSRIADEVYPINVKQLAEL
ncbi:GDSL esterase/lipase At1g29670 [Linum perenne]